VNVESGRAFCRKVPLLFAFAAGWSASVEAIDLTGAYRLAEKNDPIFEASRHGHEANRTRITQARSGLLPELRLAGRSDRAEGEVAFDQAPAVERRIRSHDLRLELTQPLVRVQNWAAYNQARLLVVQSEAQLALARQELILRVAQAYFDVLSAEDNVQVAQAQKQAVTAQLELVTRGQRAGTSTITDVHEARSRADLAESQLIAARNELEVKRSLLEQVVGSPPGELLPLKANAVLPSPAPADLQVWTLAAREQNPAVLAGRAGVEIAEREVTRARSGHYPTLDLVASTGRDYSSGSLTSPTNLETRSETTRVGVTMNFPLFASGGINARVKEAQNLVYKARAEHESARRRAEHEARQAYSGVQNGQSQMIAMGQAVRSSESAVQGNRIGHRVGTRLSVDVLNAEQQLYAAQRDFSRARYETLMQGLRLKAAAGRLRAEDLQAVNSLLGR
jgi:outer membrane protein